MGRKNSRRGKQVWCVHHKNIRFWLVKYKKKSNLEGMLVCPVKPCFVETSIGSIPLKIIRVLYFNSSRRVDSIFGSLICCKLVVCGYFVIVLLLFQKCNTFLFPCVHFIRLLIVHIMVVLQSTFKNNQE